MSSTRGRHLSSTKIRQFNTKNPSSKHPSIQHTLQFNTPFGSIRLCWTERFSVLNWRMCWTEDFFVLNWRISGLKRSGFFVLNSGVEKLRGPKLKAKFWNLVLLIILKVFISFGIKECLLLIDLSCKFRYKVALKTKWSRTSKHDLLFGINKIFEKHNYIEFIKH